eukprot:4233515-Pleurochrysis_carterae.AAC.1
MWKTSEDLKKWFITRDTEFALYQKKVFIGRRHGRSLGKRWSTVHLVCLLQSEYILTRDKRSLVCNSCQRRSCFFQGQHIVIQAVVLKTDSLIACQAQFTLDASAKVAIGHRPYLVSCTR